MKPGLSLERTITAISSVPEIRKGEMSAALELCSRYVVMKYPTYTLKHLSPFLCSLFIHQNTKAHSLQSPQLAHSIVSASKDLTQLSVTQSVPVPTAAATLNALGILLRSSLPAKLSTFRRNSNSIVSTWQPLTFFAFGIVKS